MKLTTSKIATIVKCHPNTVRLYEKWGYLQPIPRAKNKYREYSENHLNQMYLARTALPGPYPGNGISVYQLVKEAANENFIKSLELAEQYKKNVHEETKKALNVINDLKNWMLLSKNSNQIFIYSRRKASKKLSLTIDTLRTWERNGLLHIEKNELGYCKYSKKDILRLKIIRSLSIAGYSLAAIHKMFLEYDNKKITNISNETLAEILNTPYPDAPIIYVTDMWLTTLAEHKIRAQKIIKILILMKNNKSCLI